MSFQCVELGAVLHSTVCGVLVTVSFLLLYVLAAALADVPLHNGVFVFDTIASCVRLSLLPCWQTCRLRIVLRVTV